CNGEPTANPVEALVHGLLAAAQIENEIKESVWRLFEREPANARRVAALQAMRLEPALFSALTELLLAEA
ncbi:MAG: hypothetical protein CVT65_18650, partial [Actinobacteria bacterium HGW-Actinobacteria-5]